MEDNFNTTKKGILGTYSPFFHSIKNLIAFQEVEGRKDITMKLGMECFNMSLAMASHVNDMPNEEGRELLTHLAVKLKMVNVIGDVGSSLSLDLLDGVYKKYTEVKTYLEGFKDS